VNDYGVDPSRITPVGTGRGIEFPPLQRADDGRTVLFVAKRQFEEKGGLLLLQAFQRARTRRDDIRLVIAGQDAYPARFGRIPGVIAHGRVDLKQLGELYASATLFAMPALFEPWGLVYLEALSCGVPIVALRRNAMPELSGDGRFGFLSEDADPEALAGVLLDALNDPARLRRMGEEGREHVTRYYTWPQTVARMLAVMDAPTGPGEST
jgi:glycosyltransferase involved in cell wall biosynthesis